MNSLNKEWAEWANKNKMKKQIIRNYMKHQESLKLQLKKKLKKHLESQLLSTTLIKEVIQKSTKKLVQPMKYYLIKKRDRFMISMALKDLKMVE